MWEGELRHSSKQTTGEKKQKKGLHSGMFLSQAKSKMDLH